MNSAFWQTKRQAEPLPYGKTVIVRAATYVATWERRCYQDGIPDSVPDLLMKSGRAPSYKAIAFALLRNDACMKSLGFCPPVSPFYTAIKSEKRRQEMAKVQPELPPIAK